MKKEIRQVDEKRGILRVTTTDERWYVRASSDILTGLPTYEFVPSVTWIAEHYPKGIGFYKWLANTGWDEAQALKEAAGDKGSKVHAAIARMLSEQPAIKTIHIDDAVVNPSTGHPEELTLEEYQLLMSFTDWHDATKPVLVSADQVVWNDTDNYAGTVDYLCTINGQLWLIDFKTSKAIYPSHRMQVSAYKHAMPEWREAKLAILQLGYAKNRLGYKFTEIEDCYDLFLASRTIWKSETIGQAPLQRDYPLSLTLAQHEEVSCAPSGEDAKTTNGSPLTSGSPATSKRSNTTSSVSIT